MKKVLKSIDLFGVTIQLNHDKNPKATTIFGGIFTIITLILFILFLTVNATQFFSHMNATIVQSLFINGQVPYITPGNNNFKFAFGVFSSNFTALNHSVYDSEIYIEKIEAKLTSLVKYRTNITQSRCNSSYFTNTNIQNLIGLNLGFLTCSNDIEVTIGSDLNGAINGRPLFRLFVAIKPCYGVSNQSDTCLPQADVDNMLKGAFIALVNLNPFFQAENYLIPIGNYADVAYFKLDDINTQDVLYNLNFNQVIDNKGLFQATTVESNFTSFLSKSVLNRLKTDEKLLTVFTSLSTISNKISRTYPLIYTLFANVKGTTDIFIVIFMIVGNIIANFNLNKNLVNKIYDFPEFSRENQKKNKEFTSKKSKIKNLKKDVVGKDIREDEDLKKVNIVSEVILINSSNLLNKQSLKSSRSESDELKICEDIKTLFNNKKINDGKLRFSFFERLLAVFFPFCKKFYLRNNYSYFFICKQVILENLNVLNIIKLNHEFKNLKKILLTNDQRSLFDILPKEVKDFTKNSDDLVVQKEEIQLLMDYVKCSKRPDHVSKSLIEMFKDEFRQNFDIIGQNF